MSLSEKGSWDSSHRPIFQGKNGYPAKAQVTIFGGRQVAFLANEACFCRIKCLPTPENVAGTCQAGLLADSVKSEG
jgi:hypothetical protein